MQISKEYIENNLGLKKQLDSSGKPFYELEGEGIFIETQEKSGWVFIPDEPYTYFGTVEQFELFVR